VNDNSLDACLEEAVALSVKLCATDAMRSNKVIEAIQGFQTRSLLLLSELREGIRSISDRASVERCKRIFNRVVAEVRGLTLAGPQAADSASMSDTSSVSSTSSNANFTTTVTCYSRAHWFLKRSLFILWAMQSPIAANP
jgi:hypothetical protein